MALMIVGSQLLMQVNGHEEKALVPNYDEVDYYYYYYDYYDYYDYTNGGDTSRNSNRC